MNKLKHLLLILLAAGFSFLFMPSCEIQFEQPSITFISYELLELPGEYTYLSINADVRNNDSRDADINEIVYIVNVEGALSEQMTYSDHLSLGAGETLNVDMALTFLTEEAVSLLSVLDTGSELDYTVSGTITAYTALGPMDLDLDTGGTAVVDVDIDDFFLQPDIDVQTIVYSGGGPTPGGSMDFGIGADITNNAAYAATFISAVYTVTLEGGLVSEQTDYDPVDFALDSAGGAGDHIYRDDLTAAFPVNFSNLAAMIGLFNKVGSLVDYSILGTMTVTADLGGGLLEFVLPLSVSGSVVLASSF